MLKPCLLLGLGLGLGTGLSGSQSAPTVTVIREISLDPGDLHIRERDDHHEILLSGGAPQTRPGSPDLPTLPVLVSLPPDTRIQSARVEVLESRRIPGTYRVRSVPLREGSVATSGAPSPTEPSPPGVIRFSTGRMRGQGVGSVLVAPVTFDPATGVLDLAVRFRVVVEGEDAPPPLDAFIPQRESPSGERTFQEALSQLTGDALAPSARARFLPATVPTGPFAPGFRPTVDGSPVEMVIITTSDQEAQYQLLADFRTKTGLSTVVRTVAWIEANYPHGADRAQTLRNFIRDAAARWGTAWVLLGGDTGVIPVRHVVSEGFGNEEVSTDLYYSDLDGNWNADGDAHFGEGELSQNPVDAVDLLPDVWVGRLPSNNAAEAGILVGKTLQYAQNPPLGYQKDVLLAAEVLFPDTWTPGQAVALDGAVLAEGVRDTVPPGFRVVRLYENHTAWPGALPEVKSAVVDSMNSGFHLVHFVAHGFINTISVGLGAQTLGNLDAESLINGAQQFLLVTMDCTSSAVDYNCIAERFLLNPGGGAVASIGATEVEFPTTAYVYQSEFYHQIYWDSSPELGRALGLAKIPFVVYSDQDNPHRWSQLSLILLGDPSLAFWTDVPQPLSVTYAPAFEMGDESFAVTVARGGQPVAGARVTLTKVGDEYASALTDGAGVATVPFRPDLTGTFTVAATAQNALPFLGAAEVAPRSTAYLFAQTQNLTDTGGSAQGNGDGRLDAGETVELRFGVKNNGCSAATGVLANLSTTDPRLTILDGTSGYPNLNPGTTAIASDRMLVRVLRSTPDGTEIHAALNLSGPGGPFVEDVILYVHAPVVEYRSQAIRDSVGNGNNNAIITANEDFVILPVLRNAGRGALRGASVRLRSTDPAVLLADTVSTVGDIAPGATAGNSADGLRLRLTNVTSPHELVVVVRDAYGEVFSRRIDITSPGGVADPFARGSTSAITLSWTPVPDPDLLGYEIQRSVIEGGPFTRVNAWTVLRTALYEDNDLPGFTRFYYRIAGVDSSGNRGPWSPLANTTTSLPIHAGWPADVGAQVPAGVNVADLDADGNLEVIGAGAEIVVFGAGGEDFVDGDQSAITRGPISDTGGTTFWNTPAVGDLEGDGSLEVAAIGFGDAQLHLVNAQGQPVAGWPQNADPLGIGAPNPVGSVCLADVDGNGDLEVFATVGPAMLAWHHDGTELADGDANPATLGVLLDISPLGFCYGTPTVANIDAEPFREIVAGMRDGKLYVWNHDGSPYPGFPFAAGGDITSSPAVGDIDLDGRMEIVFGSSNGQVWALRSDLTVATGFPKSVPLTEDWDSSPALGDVTGDGALDVVIASSNDSVYVFSGTDGDEPNGFPVSLAGNGTPMGSRSSPVLADLDADGSLDIVVGDRAGRLHALDAAGDPLPGFSIQTQNRIDGAAAVADVDGDGLTEVVAESSDRNLYVWDTPWTFDPQRAPWPMFKGNPRHTGFAGDSAFGTHVGVPPQPNAPLLVQAGPNPFRNQAQIRYRVATSEAQARVRLIVYDLSGREVTTLVAQDQIPGVYTVFWTGDDAAGRRVGAGVYLYRIQVGERGESGKLVLLP